MFIRIGRIRRNFVFAYRVGFCEDSVALLIWFAYKKKIISEPLTKRFLADLYCGYQYSLSLDNETILSSENIFNIYNKIIYLMHKNCWDKEKILEFFCNLIFASKMRIEECIIVNHILNNYYNYNVNLCTLFDRLEFRETIEFKSDTFYPMDLTGKKYGDMCSVKSYNFLYFDEKTYEELFNPITISIIIEYEKNVNGSIADILDMFNALLDLEIITHNDLEIIKLLLEDC